MSDSKQNKRYNVESEKEKEQRFIEYLIDNEGEAILVDEIVDEVDGIDFNHATKSLSMNLPYFFYRVGSFHRAEGRFYYAEVDWLAVGFVSMMISLSILTLGWVVLFGL